MRFHIQTYIRADRRMWIWEILIFLPPRPGSAETIPLKGGFLHFDLTQIILLPPSVIARKQLPEGQNGRKVT